MKTLHEKFILLMKAVPEGRVATYGQIARLAGSPAHTRQVVWVLHSSSKKYKIPWQRIVNSRGQIGIKDVGGHLRQKALLKKEGIEFDGNKIDLEIYQWAPKALDVKKALSKKLPTKKL